MIALNMLEIKDFMNKLLCSELFDNFLIQEAVIQGNMTWSASGSLNADFYSPEELEENGLSGLDFLPFGQVRPLFLNLIRGKRTPTYFKFVFLLSPKNLARTLEQTKSSFTPTDISGMFVNLKFQQNKLMLTTGVSYRIFSTDKSLEFEWDQLMKRFLKNHEISYEEL